MFAVCSVAHATVGRRDTGATCAPDSRAATAQTSNTGGGDRGPAEDHSRSDDAGFDTHLAGRRQFPDLDLLTARF